MEELKGHIMVPTKGRQLHQDHTHAPSSQGARSLLLEGGRTGQALVEAKPWGALLWLQEAGGPWEARYFVAPTVKQAQRAAHRRLLSLARYRHQGLPGQTFTLPQLLGATVGSVGGLTGLALLPWEAPTLALTLLLGGGSGWLTHHLVQGKEALEVVEGKFEAGREVTEVLRLLEAFPLDYSPLSLPDLVAGDPYPHQWTLGYLTLLQEAHHHAEGHFQEEEIKSFLQDLLANLPTQGEEQGAALAHLEALVEDLRRKQEEATEEFRASLEEERMREEQLAWEKQAALYAPLKSLLQDS